MRGCRRPTVLRALSTNPSSRGSPGAEHHVCGAPGGLDGSCGGQRAANTSPAARIRAALTRRHAVMLRQRHDVLHSTQRDKQGWGLGLGAGAGGWAADFPHRAGKMRGQTDALEFNFPALKSYDSVKCQVHDQSRLTSAITQTPASQCPAPWFHCGQQAEWTRQRSPHASSA